MKSHETHDNVILETQAEENTACKKETVQRAIQDYYNNAPKNDAENLSQPPKSANNRTSS